MNIRLIVLLLVCQISAYAQQFKFPALPTQGKSLAAMIPKNWKLLDSVSGDLNNDREKDIALILEYHTQVRENRAYGDNTTEIIMEIQKPRILAIYFREAGTENYRLAVQNNNFILRAQEGGAKGDPLRPVRIDSNTLQLAFEGGASWRWKLNYSFKYRGQDWVLEKAGNCSYHSESGEMADKIYDFNTKKKTVTIGTIHNRESANETTVYELPAKSLRTFRNFKKPWTWQIGPDEFL